ncbi:AAA family ATPase [Angustibacter speluncae]
MVGEQDGALEREVRAEQGVVDALYGRLDALRARAAADLAAVRRSRSEGTHQARSERDAYATLYENRLAQLWAVEDRLAFGRLDLVGEGPRYVGRLGLTDDDQTRLLVDWRAEAALPFYQATAGDPKGVVRRRHLVTRGRTVSALEDEVLDLEGLQGDLELAGEGALMAAVNAQRTGRMGDIVATIQAEQDRIIRSDLSGVLVVQGGPGTGKTAVALHRAAYLLYSHRDRLAGGGVLVVGPSPVFLRYIEQVLPSLGETGVVMVTAGELLPGVRATRHDDPDVARLKGDLRMAEAVGRAVRARQRIPAGDEVLDVEGIRVTLTRRMVASARDKARRTGRPHNLARQTFVKDVLAQLADRLAREIARRSGQVIDPEDRVDLLADLRASVDVRRAVNLAWMPLTPQTVVARLLSDRDRLEHAAPWLRRHEVDALLRERDAAWTVEDVPLLDEAAELLGEDDSAARAESRRAAAARREEVEYARGVLQLTGAGDYVSAEDLAARFGDDAASLTTAERAAGDRTWAFQHVVVDEAQELSPMAWRVLARRNPMRSMTVVGDLAQTRSAAGADTWAQVLDPVASGRWRVEELTVSYRTPQQIMDVAAAVLAAAGSSAVAPRAVREGRWAPGATQVEAAAVPSAAAKAVRAQLADLAGGRVAVIGTGAAVPAVLEAVVADLGPERVGTGALALDREVAVLAVDEAKGLEFDGVVLVEPADLVADGPRGVNDLYVALTRPTQQLHVVHSGTLPAGMGSLGGA